MPSSLGKICLFLLKIFPKKFLFHSYASIANDLVVSSRELSDFCQTRETTSLSLVLHTTSRRNGLEVGGLREIPE